MSSEKPLVVTVAHDYLCPWCWAGYIHSVRLKEEFPKLKLNWVGYELLPEELGPIPEYTPRPRDPENPTRFDRFLDTEGIVIPAGRTIGIVRTHNALEGAEWFKEHAPDQFDGYNGDVYRAFWEHSLDISNLDILTDIAVANGGNPDSFRMALEGKYYHGKIVRFDDDAYSADVTHVPTFIFRGERCAEAPYDTIRDLATRFLVWYDK
jgi:predicted DsbA family dithiol-disulfide isomerase